MKIWTGELHRSLQVVAPEVQSAWESMQQNESRQQITHI